MNENSIEALFGLADEKVEKREKLSEKQKRKIDQLDQDMAWLLSHPQGRRVLTAFLAKCRLNFGNFTGNSSTFKLEGQRELGLDLISWIRAASPVEARKIIADLFVGDDHD
jgi:deoxyribodipyrimidine photolyase-like uncharacterized protein